MVLRGCMKGVVARDRWNRRGSSMEGKGRKQACNEFVRVSGPHFAPLGLAFKWNP